MRQADSSNCTHGDDAWGMEGQQCGRNLPTVTSKSKASLQTWSGTGFVIRTLDSWTTFIEA